MLIGPLPEDDVNHLRLMYTTRYAERKPGLNKSEGCWCCIILYYPLISMYKKRYKRPFWTTEEGPVIGNTGFPCVFFSYSVFWLNSHLGAEARHVYLLAPSSKICERGSPRRGTLRYSNGCWWPNVDSANSLSWSFIGIPRKLSYSAFFSPLIFPTTLFLSNLPLYL